MQRNGTKTSEIQVRQGRPASPHEKPPLTCSIRRPRGSHSPQFENKPTLALPHAGNTALPAFKGASSEQGSGPPAGQGASPGRPHQGAPSAARRGMAQAVPREIHPGRRPLTTAPATGSAGRTDMTDTSTPRADHRTRAKPVNPQGWPAQRTSHGHRQSTHAAQAVTGEARGRVTRTGHCPDDPPSPGVGHQARNARDWPGPGDQGQAGQRPDAGITAGRSRDTRLFQPSRQAKPPALTSPRTPPASARYALPDRNPASRSGLKPCPATPGGAKHRAAGDGASRPPEASAARSAHGAKASRD